MKPQVLFITIESPYPAHSGGTLNSLKILEFLNEKYQLCLVCLERSRTNDISAIKIKFPEMEMYSVKVNSERSIKNYLGSFLKGIPFYVYRYYSDKGVEKVKTLSAKADLILIDHLAMFSYIDNIHHSNIVLHSHNCESSLWEKYMNTQSNFFLKKLLSYEVGRLRRYEARVLKRVRLVLGSSNDLICFEKLGVEKSRMVEVIHPGDEEVLNSEIKIPDTTHGTIFYFGTLSWIPNEDGLIWFLQKIWPLVKKEIPFLKMKIAGKGATETLIKVVSESADVCLIGFAENLKEEFATADMMVVPQRFGSGMKVKVLTALSAGIPMVVSPEAVSGLEVKDGEHCFIAEDEEAFCMALITLFHSRKLKVQFAERGRKLIQEQYTFKKYWDGIELFF